MTKAICWTPGPEFGHHLRRFIRSIETDFGEDFGGQYERLHKWSIEQLDQFWMSVFRYTRVCCSVAPEKAIDCTAKMSQVPIWFPGCQLNYAENVLSGGAPDDVALMAFCEQQPVVFSLTFKYLAEQVQAVAKGLVYLGVSSGDRVAGLLPNCMEAVICYLACAYIGAIWCSAAPDFGVQGIVQRLLLTQPKVIFAATHTVYRGKTFDQTDKLATMMKRLHGITQHVVLVPYVQTFPSSSSNGLVSPDKAVGEPIIVRDKEYLSLRDQAEDRLASYVSANSYSLSLKSLFDMSSNVPHLKPAQLPFSHPLAILFSSGTTGPPKCIIHSAGGTLIKHLCEHQFHCDLRRGDRLLYLTNIGWMMWNWMVSALASGTGIVLYEGCPFDGNLWSMVNSLDISVLGVGAKWLAVLEDRNVKPGKQFKLSSLRTILSTGSPLAPRSFDFVYRDIKSNVMLGSISGGTDMIGCCVGCCPLLPVHRGQIQCRILGMAVESWDEKGNSILDQNGDLVITRPFPSMPVGFWGDDDGSKFQAAYFSKFKDVWAHGDFIVLHSDTNGVTINGRSDATLNPSGIRFGSAEIYNLIEHLPFVSDSLCVGQSNRDRTDERVILFVKLTNSVEEEGPLATELQSAISHVIRSQLSPRFVPAVMYAVSNIPYTISGKKVELAVRRLLEGQPPERAFAKESLADPSVVDHYVRIAARIGPF